MSALQADVDHLIDQATVKLSGASSAGIKAELFDVLHEFFASTDAWQETIPVTVPAATTDVSVIPSEGGKVIRLQYVIDANMLPQEAFLIGFDTIHLRNPYSAQTSLSARVIKTVIFPTDKHSIPDIPEWLLQVYPRAILDGVLGTMMNQQQKSYTNLKLGMYHLQRFRDAMATAAAQVRYSQTAGAQAWRFPNNFHISSQRGSVSTINQKF